MKKNNLIAFLIVISSLSYSRNNGNNLNSYTIFGSNSITTDTHNVQIGKDSKSEEDKKSIAIGSSSMSRGTNGVAIGNKAHAGAMPNLSNDVENTVAIGTDSKATALDAIAIGNKAHASTKYGIAIGTETKTDGIGAISLGYKSEANSDSIAIGKEAVGYGKGIALGENSHSRRYSVAIGYMADSKGVYSYGNVVIGSESSTDENLNFSTAIGYKAKVEESYSTAIGSSSIAKKRDDRLGYDMFTNKVVKLEDKLEKADKSKYTKLKEEIEKLKAEKGTLDKDAKDIIDKAYNSRTEDEKNKLTELNKKITSKITEINQKYGEYYKIVNVWEATYGEVSIGDAKNGITRQITGLAAGKEDTDAVNVAQLKSLYNKFESENKTYFHVNSGENKDTGDKDTNLGEIGEAAGATGYGAIAVGIKTKASGLNSIAIGKSSNSSGDNSISMGIDSKASGLTSMAIGVDAKASGITSIAIGSNANASGFGAISLGLSSSSSGMHSLAIGQLAKASEEKSVALGSESETTKAVATKDIEINGIKYGEFAGKTPFSVISIGYKDRERQLQHVAAGQISKESTDAINGSQLYWTNNVLGKFIDSTKSILGGTVYVIKSGDDAGKLTMNNIGDTGKDNIHDAIKHLKESITFNVMAGKDGTGTALGTIESIKIKKDEVLTFKAGDNLTITQNGKDFIYALNKDLKGMNSIKFGDDDSVHISKDGLNNGGKKITNVADGKDSTDAVNKGQLDKLENKISETKTEIDNKIKEIDKKLDEKIEKIDKKIGDTKKELTDKIDNVTKTLKTEITANGGETENNTKGAITLTYKKSDAGHNIYDISLSTTQLKLSSGGKVETLNDEDTKKIANAGEVAKAINTLGNNTLSFGGDSGVTEKQSLNKDGGLNFNIKGSENIITKAKGNEVSIDISEKMKTDISKGVAANSGVANAIAMANLPQVSTIGDKRHNIAGSYGYYNGENAFALGLSGVNETGTLVYRASGALNTKGHVSLGAGLGYQFDNIGKRSKEILKLQRNGNINLLDEKVYELDKEFKALKENNKTLESRIAELEKLMKELRRN
ncbi:YadA-like family protein [Streptobacillus moniliformis]|uniref:YadA-like family protein n=1 Tax=Streptobacillus moniliformis TaxID=34105 RepID=UPI0007E419D5|nr:YadA-like family protein [Streptobacillus moniliformis]